MTSSKRLLLDTHVFLWWRSDPERIRWETIDAIAAAQTVFVSSASAWEIAIKQALGRIEVPESVSSGLIASGFLGLDVNFAHAEQVAGLPHHHRDPFDRILVAQAQVEGLILVTKDAQIGSYDLEVLWA